MSDPTSQTQAFKVGPGRPRPVAPMLRTTPHNAFSLLRALRDNPLTAWTAAHYEHPVLAGDTPLGRFAMVSDPALVRRVLVDDVDNYRKDDLQGRLLKPALGNGLLTAGGEDWKRQRRTFAPLFTPRTVANFALPMAASAYRLVERWMHQRDGRPLDAAEEIAQTMLDVLRSTLFVGGFGRDPREFRIAATHYFETQGRIDPLDVIGAPDWLPRIGRILAKPSLEYFPRLVQAVIAERRQLLARGSAAPDDFIATLLAARDEGSGEGLSDADIAANIITFIGAGFETPANSLSWSLYLLSIDDEWRTRIEAEADRELPDGRFIDGTLDRLVATRALIEESMRLYPPVAIISRAAVVDHELGGHKIPAGTTVVVAPWVLHRHRLLWDEPDRFEPERFMPGNREQIDRFSYIPFGAGPRVCIGAAFAMQEMTITLATIARHFRLSLMPDHRIQPVHRVTMRPEGGMMMTLHRRSGAPRSAPLAAE